MLLGRSRHGISPDISKNLPALPEVASLTFEQLTSKTQEPTQLSTDLFSVLVRDPRELLQDYVERPEAYRYEALPVIMSLVARARDLHSLTEEERALLNNAAMTYAERSKPLNTSNSKSPESPALRTADSTELAWGDENAEEDDQEIAYEASATDALVGTEEDTYVGLVEPEAHKEVSLEDFVLDGNWWKKS